MNTAEGTDKAREAQYAPSGPPPAYDYSAAQQPYYAGYPAGQAPPQHTAYATGYSYPSAVDNKGYLPPGGAPVQQQPAPMVIIQQPGVPLTNPPNDYFAYAVFVTLCCFWPLGIFAILKSSGCREAISRGDRPLAEDRSRQARNLANISLAIGIGSIILSIVIITVYMVSIVNSTSY